MATRKNPLRGELQRRQDMLDKLHRKFSRSETILSRDIDTLKRKIILGEDLLNLGMWEANLRTHELTSAGGREFRKLVNILDKGVVNLSPGVALFNQYGSDVGDLCINFDDAETMENFIKKNKIKTSDDDGH